MISIETAKYSLIIGGFNAKLGKRQEGIEDYVEDNLGLIREMYEVCGNYWSK